MFENAALNRFLYSEVSLCRAGGRWALQEEGLAVAFPNMCYQDLFFTVLGEGAETGPGISMPCSGACVLAASRVSVAKTRRPCWRARGAGMRAALHGLLSRESVEAAVWRGLECT